MNTLETKTVARNTSDPTMKATSEKKTAPLKLPKMTKPAPSLTPKSGGTHAESQSVHEQEGSS